MLDAVGRKIHLSLCPVFLSRLFTTRRHVGERHDATNFDRRKNHNPGGDEIIRS